MFDNVRSPIGFVADIGTGLGGFGAIVLGGRPTAAARRARTCRRRCAMQAGGMFYISFRGNILWGAPAAVRRGHAHATRGVSAPRGPRACARPRRSASASC